MQLVRVMPSPSTTKDRGPGRGFKSLAPAFQTSGPMKPPTGPGPAWSKSARLGSAWGFRPGHVHHYSMLATSSTQSKSDLHTTNRKDAQAIPSPSQTPCQDGNTKHGAVVVITNPMYVKLISETDTLIMCASAMLSKSALKLKT